jgi:hypothetical protein
MKASSGESKCKYPSLERFHPRTIEKFTLVNLNLPPRILSARIKKVGGFRDSAADAMRHESTERLLPRHQKAKDFGP